MKRERSAKGRWQWTRERNRKAGLGEEATRRTAAQTPRHKIHNLIQLSKLLSTFWAAATHAVPSPRIPGNLDQRDPAAFYAGISRSTFHLTTPVLPVSLSFPPFWPFHRRYRIQRVRLGSTIERARPSCNRD